jgi:hypothetical protein
MVLSSCSPIFHKTKSDRHPGRESPDNRRSQKPVACTNHSLQVTACQEPSLHSCPLGVTATIDYTSLLQSNHVVYSMLP